MPDLTLTSGGATALAAHQAAGTNPFGAGSKIKLGTGQYTPDGSETDLMTEMSPAIEFDVGGVVSSMDTFTVGFTDSSATNEYDLGEVGIFDVNDVLIWIVSQPSTDGFLSTKVMSGHLVVAFPIQVPDGTTTANITLTTTINYPTVVLATGLDDTRANAVALVSQVKPVTDANASAASTAASAAAAAQNTANNAATAASNAQGTADAKADPSDIPDEASANDVRDRSGTDYVSARRLPSVLSPNIVAAQITSGSATTTEADAGLSLTITPRLSTKKILVQVAGGYANATHSAGEVFIYKGATKLATGAAGDFGGSTFAVAVIDSPNTTAAVTYKVRWVETGGGSIVDARTNYPLVLIAQEID